MPYLNHTAFIGNLTKAPELRFQSTGDKQALCLLNLALNRDSKDGNGEKVTHTTFINDIEVWGPQGEACARFLTSGSMVFVEGRIDIDQWQDKQTGARRSRMKVIGDNVQFLRIKHADDEAGAGPAGEPQASTGVHESDFDAAPLPSETQHAGEAPRSAGRLAAPAKARRRVRPEPLRAAGG